MKIDKDINNNIDNKHYQSIMESACMKFRCILSRDEIEAIKLTSLWRALNRYDGSKGTKFTSYLYRGTFQECKTYARFIARGRKYKDATFGQYHPNLPDVGDAVASIELIDELKNIKDGYILIEHYYNNMKIKDIAKKYKLETKVIAEKKKKALDILKNRLN